MGNLPRFMENSSSYREMEIPQLPPPQPLCLPIEVVEVKKRATMTEKQFITTLTAKGPTYTHPLLMRTQVTMSLDIMQCAPIPAHFVYDGFEKNLDAALAHERLLCHCTTQNDMITHAKNFL